MSKSNGWTCVVSCLFGLCVTQTALAEPKRVTETTSDGDYSYRFDDESLLAETLQNVGDIYRGRPKFARVLLLRPRVQLVQEILKSAEDL
jgi:hypothetical protein